MTRAMRRARRRSGLAAFQRDCGCSVSTACGGRRVKRWQIPGTPEAGRYAMLRALAESIYADLCNESRAQADE